MLADRELGEEAVIKLRSESKDTSAKAAKDQCHLTRGRGIDTKDVVGLKEKRERLDANKRKWPKIARKRKKLLRSVLPLYPALQKARKKCIGIRNGPLNLLSKREGR